MKTSCIAILLCTFIAQTLLPNELPKPKKLRLHFDVNKTIIATDAVQGKNLNETLNSILAEFTFYTWDGANKQSYYAYISDSLAQDNPHLARSDELFKKKRNEHIKDFAQFLQAYPQLYSTYKQEKKAMKKILSTQHMVIFPSFYKLIQWLNEHYPASYALYLRTFGTDLPEIVTLLEKNTSLIFAGFGSFASTALSLIDTDASLFEFFTTGPLAHFALQDDYNYWKSHNFQALGGKPFAINIQDTSTIFMFFDDNADDNDKPIIYPFGPAGESLNTQELLENGTIVAVNPKEAILNEDYFINKVKMRFFNP